MLGRFLLQFMAIRWYKFNKTSSYACAKYVNKDREIALNNVYKISDFQEEGITLFSYFAKINFRVALPFKYNQTLQKSFKLFCGDVGSSLDT